MINSVYICSAARSGSTILDMLLGTHPDVIPVGELNQLPKNIALNSVCSCGSAIRECEFWSPIVNRVGAEMGRDLWQDPYALDLGMIQAGVEIDRRRQTRAYLARRTVARGWVELCQRAGVDFKTSPLVGHFRKSVENIVHLHALIRDQSGKQVVVDSNKDFRQSVMHYVMAPQTTRLILLSRDGRGVMASYMRTGRTREEALRHWQKYYERSLPWLESRVRPEHIIRVHYETLVADPEAEIGRVVGLLGLPPVTGVAAKVSHKSHIVNGNKMFLKPITGIAADERWATELSAGDQAYFAEHGLALSLRLGHALSGRG
jgi:hypothetical protein